ncbi:hypothetical protein L228DRAFT_85699 [Xylona heveae TC161]|uniref:Uncharacterized protein n=1 Tax=Xylona heveae (strain CBS 132557 / TC161) TaxID=1328760 RepID=A0A165HUL9_XYLHT|nr:hypothetical protein L228DRAFT_85699 [Xylona heveae TC161]KZF23948.1 hypothetical protein L228DRAFT_85699 [Xylona heveae TC161]
MTSTTGSRNAISRVQPLRFGNRSAAFVRRLGEFEAVRKIDVDRKATEEDNWYNYARAQVDRTIEQSKQYKQDLIARRVREEVSRKLANGNVLILQRLAPSSFKVRNPTCSHPFCPARSKTRSSIIYGFSLEKYTALAAERVPSCIFEGRRRRPASGSDNSRWWGQPSIDDYSYAWFCVGCLESLWRGDEMLQGAIDPADAVSAPPVARVHPNLPHLPVLADICQFIFPELRSQVSGFFTLLPPQARALLKWKNAISRQEILENQTNRGFLARIGLLSDYDEEDPDAFEVKFADRPRPQGVLQPSGAVIEMTAAEVKGKLLSEVMTAVEAKIRAEWQRVGYSEQPATRPARNPPNAAATTASTTVSLPPNTATAPATSNPFIPAAASFASQSTSASSAPGSLSSPAPARSFASTPAVTPTLNTSLPASLTPSFSPDTASTPRLNHSLPSRPARSFSFDYTLLDPALPGVPALLLQAASTPTPTPAENTSETMDMDMDIDIPDVNDSTENAEDQSHGAQDVPASADEDSDIDLADPFLNPRKNDRFYGPPRSI